MAVVRASIAGASTSTASPGAPLGRRPLCIDLFCGLGGWTEGFLSEGWDVIGFDVERHAYGDQRYPAQLVLQDVLTLHGRQFREVDCIVASPPCQEFSYMAMPWSRAKQIAAALCEEVPFPEGYTGSRTVSQLRALFDSCFRIQREACEAAGRHIPMVIENVKGAQPWVGPAKAKFGSFYFWGDVAMVGGRVVAGGLRFGDTVRAARRHRKVNSKYAHSGSWKTEDGKDWRDEPSVQAAMALAGVKQGGSGDAWFDGAVDERRREAAAAIREARNNNSRSDSRKAASAQIAKIPFRLSSYIARVFKA